MKLKFKINYHTNFGQNIYVSGSCGELGKNNSTEALPMNYTWDGNWEVEIDFDVKKGQRILLSIRNQKRF